MSSLVAVDAEAAASAASSADDALGGVFHVSAADADVSVAYDGPFVLRARANGILFAVDTECQPRAMPYLFSDSKAAEAGAEAEGAVVQQSGYNGRSNSDHTLFSASVIVYNGEFHERRLVSSSTGANTGLILSRRQGQGQGALRNVHCIKIADLPALGDGGQGRILCVTASGLLGVAPTTGAHTEFVLEPATSSSSSSFANTTSSSSSSASHLSLNTIVCLRHAERIDRATEAQGNDWITTASRPHDPTLSPLGIEQARAVGRELKELDLNISRIYCSPLVRCVMTADLVAGELGLGANSICVEKGLVEEAKSFRGYRSQNEPPPNWHPLLLPVVKAANEQEQEGRKAEGDSLSDYSSRLDASYVSMVDVQHVCVDTWIHCEKGKEEAAEEGGKKKEEKKGDNGVVEMWSELPSPELSVAQALALAQEAKDEVTLARCKLLVSRLLTSTPPSSSSSSSSSSYSSSSSSREHSSCLLLVGHGASIGGISKYIPEHGADGNNGDGGKDKKIEGERSVASWCVFDRDGSARWSSRFSQWRHSIVEGEEGGGGGGTRVQGKEGKGDAGFAV